MNIKGLLVIFLLSFGLMSANAQDKKPDESKREKIEKFKERKAEFLKKELQLTDAEAAAFIPLVNELMEKKYEVYRNARTNIRDMRNKTEKSEADYKKTIEGMLDSQIKEAELQKEYYQKFMKVLPIEKVYKYHEADMKFMKNSVDKKERLHRDSNSPSDRKNHDSKDRKRGENKKRPAPRQ